MNYSMRTTLRRLGWGLVFPLVDIHVGPIDVLPDLIGYLLIVSALRQLGAGYGVDKTAIWLAAILALLAVPRLLVNTSMNIDQYTTSPFALHIYGQGVVILHSLLAYRVFQGLYANAITVAPPKLKDAIVNRRKFYMTVFAAQLFFYPFLLNLESGWVMLLMGLQLCFILAELLLIRLPFRLSRIRIAPPIGDRDNAAAELL
ncbi:hypothetical protein ACFFSY_23510 [Paenibacillus aurantiacus]|uniref:Uncharacterized protein n=1 Tax=Paenibacillus aurantiacus TaxID=1936118 RepID=A0ABV5KUM1_9BACL